AMIAVGLDAVEISAGISSGKLGSVRALNDAVTEDVYFRERAASVKRAVGIPVMMVGGIRKVETAEAIIASGEADFVSICRPLIRQPDLINRWAIGDRERSTCISCNKCQTIIDRKEPLECGEDRRIVEEG
ncbi:MAG: HisA/HisF-related TIM barrel protein, partial [Dehalococcoidia bacterium]|nr:HisA/HisF-related TIM barrel protein [Dehalococcoidia bacterium]